MKKIFIILFATAISLYLNAAKDNNQERWGCFIEITGDFVPDVEVVTFKSQKECHDSCSTRCTKVTGRRTDISD